ncbi:VIN3-like protein 2 [Mangifera indica]|uniref:VIN3-like protein 2 n=1 Tax=Mangifera indica TaxID=29780 RepID=UPI001CFB48F2|nr:VIN3-like protein 2 [Mangifera indica]XP_044511727.1 VIN3-like protein 2 [Mangifera indica]
MSQAEERCSGRESMFSGYVLDPEKCSRLTLGEKRELVYEIAQWSKNATEILSSFSRRELLEIICAEMGKERKYSGYTKFRMIEHLLKLVSQKSQRNNTENIPTSWAKTQTGCKRKRQEESLTKQLNGLNQVTVESGKAKNFKCKVCQNVACRASLSLNDAFCKRCSCCICHQYDDNKDPSLWLTCGSDSCNDNNSCGMSCHLECALEKTSFKIGCSTELDGSFYCVSCGKVNGLLRTWRKQMLIAKETRRVDVLCLRISLSHKILLGTEKYQKLLKIVETALQTLKNEVGPLNLLCTKMARGIVSRLSCGAEVQKLCASAVDTFDSMIVNDPQHLQIEKMEPMSCLIQFEESSATSVVIVLEYKDHLIKDFAGCRLWHRKSNVKDYPGHPTFIVLRPEKRFSLTGLDPSTEYFCKISLFKSTGSFGVWEAKWITPALSGSSVAKFEENRKAENTTIAQIHSQVESINSSNTKLASSKLSVKRLPSLADIKKNKDEAIYLQPPLLSPESISPSTPCKCDGMRKVPGLGCERRMEESDYEYSVRVVKLLEQEGHIDAYFRVKFLTWFSLKATMQERRVVSVFVDALNDDPTSLAGQLVHTFKDEIYREQKPVHGNGFCTKLWH